MTRNMKTTFLAKLKLFLPSRKTKKKHLMIRQKLRCPIEIIVPVGLKILIEFYVLQAF